MPTLTVTKTYADGDTLFEADLDNIKDDIENFVNVTKLNDDNIQASGITGSTKLVDASVSSAKIASAAITTSKIDDLAVTTAKINDLGVTTGKINDLAVTTGKIADSNVTTAKIADGNVTLVKLSSNKVVSSSIGTQSFTSASYIDATNLSATITSTGNDLEILLIPDGTAALSQATPAGLSISGGTYGATEEVAYLRFYDVSNSLEIAGFVLKTVTQPFSYSKGVWTPNCFQCLYIPTAGSINIKVQVARGGTTTASVNLSYCKLYIRERK